MIKIKLDNGNVVSSSAAKIIMQIRGDENVSKCIDVLSRIYKDERYVICVEEGFLYDNWQIFTKIAENAETTESLINDIGWFPYSRAWAKLT